MEHHKIPAQVEKSGMLVKEGIQSESSGTIFISESRENPEGLKDIPQIINVQLDLILTVLLVLINGKNRILKSVFQKKFGFPVDVLEEGLFCKRLRAFHQLPPSGQILLWDERHQWRR